MELYTPYRENEFSVGQNKQSVTERTCVTMRIQPREPPSPKGCEKAITEINRSTIKTFQASFLNYPAPSSPVLPPKTFSESLCRGGTVYQAPLLGDVSCQVEAHCSLVTSTPSDASGPSPVSVCAFRKVCFRFWLAQWHVAQVLQKDLWCVFCRSFPLTWKYIIAAL